ncbi:MAG: hypothetical protein ACHREM_06625, partial [Polyangiales bacterium]
MDAPTEGELIEARRAVAILDETQKRMRERKAFDDDTRRHTDRGIEIAQRMGAVRLMRCVVVQASRIADLEAQVAAATRADACPTCKAVTTPVARADGSTHGCSQCPRHIVRAVAPAPAAPAADPLANPGLDGFGVTIGTFEDSRAEL